MSLLISKAHGKDDLETGLSDDDDEWENIFELASLHLIFYKAICRARFSTDYTIAATVGWPKHIASIDACNASESHILWAFPSLTNYLNYISVYLKRIKMNPIFPQNPDIYWWRTTFL